MAVKMAANLYDVRRHSPWTVNVWNIIQMCDPLPEIRDKMAVARAH